MPQAIEAYKAAVEAIKKAKEECKALATQAFAEASEALFREHPILRGFSWTQYTPYFNDGDPCVFGANTDYPDVLYVDGKAMDGEDIPDDEDYEDNQISAWDIKSRREKGEPLTEKHLAGEAVLTFLATFSGETYEEMFGDHVRVMVERTPAGKIEAEVEEYSHD